MSHVRKSLKLGQKCVHFTTRTINIGHAADAVEANSAADAAAAAALLRAQMGFYSDGRQEHI